MDKNTSAAIDPPNAFDELSGAQALQVLYALGQRDDAFAAAIMEEAKKVVFRPIQVEAVANRICATLNFIPVEDCWDAVTSQRGGYRDVTEVAYDMFHDAMEEFVAEVEKYHRLGKCNLEALYIQGFILGLYKFDMDPKTDFHVYIEDDICHFANELVTDWIDAHPNLAKDKRALFAFIKKSCPKWEFLHSSNLYYQEEDDES